MMVLETNTIHIKTLTPLWTGDVKGESAPAKETSIIGSLRWWNEALVRGLDGYACDITSETPKERCDFGRDKDDICDVCKLFGCTGWSRRFRLEVSGISEHEIIKGKGINAGVKEGVIFSIKIVPLYELNPIQKWLFKKTLFLIERYGAIGGRTARKPQKSNIGLDYGLIEIIDYGTIENWDSFIDKKEVKTHLMENKKKIKRENKYGVFDFRNYWILEGIYFNRFQINTIVNRDRKGHYKHENDFDRWLGGEEGRGKKMGKSKKIFSFSNGKRVFGYVRKEEEIDRIKEKIDKISKIRNNFRTGKEILGDL